MNRKILLCAPLLVALSMVAPSSAHAFKKVYSLNLGLNKPFLDESHDYDGGLNIEGLVHLPIPFPLFDLEVEAKLGVNTWAAKGAGTDARLFRGSVGLRGGINFAAYPYGYVHLGYGSLTGPWKYSASSVAGPIAEIGGGLDVTALPYVRFGLFGAYNHMIMPDDATFTGSTDRDGQWFSFGIKLSYVSDGSD